MFVFSLQLLGWKQIRAEMVLLHMLSDLEQVIDFFLFLLTAISWHINCNFIGC